MDKHTNILYCLAVMFTIWCTWNSVKSGNLVEKVNSYKQEVHLFERQVASLIDRLDMLGQRETNVVVKEIVEEVKTPTEDIEVESVE